MRREGWKEAIDLILIDGDHAEAAVERDWQDWSHFVKTRRNSASFTMREFSVWVDHGGLWAGSISLTGSFRNGRSSGLDDC